MKAYYTIFKLKNFYLLHEFFKDIVVDYINMAIFIKHMSTRIDELTNI